MRDEKITAKVEQKLAKAGYAAVKASCADGIARLEGEVDTWEQVVEAGYAAASVRETREVVNKMSAKNAPAQARVRKATPKMPFYNPELPKKADVVIVGAGVIGCFIARELSRYKLDAVLLEKGSDVAQGATKANSGQIHNGMGEKSGTLKKELCVKAWPMFERITKELDVPYKKKGLLILATRETFPQLPGWLARILAKKIFPKVVAGKARSAGERPKILNREQIFEMEPNVTDRVISGVLSPEYGVICPMQLTVAAAENAIMNGAKVILETDVTGIRTKDGRVTGVETDRGTIETSFVVNAAGVHSDEVAAMADLEEFTIHPRKGSILLFDKDANSQLNHQVREFHAGGRKGHSKGGGILMSPHNIHWGPTAIDVPAKDDRSVTREEIDGIYDGYGPTLPAFPRRSVITAFAGLRAATYKEDFVINASGKVRGFVNAAGIQSPGLTAAPVVAERVAGLLSGCGLALEKKDDFDPVRRKAPCFASLSDEEKAAAIGNDPAFGRVICRCETITEGEIVDAIRRSPLPVLSIDAVKRRTRAGMGRCQGGFCMPRVAEILAREHGVPLDKITKDGAGSGLLVARTKENLGE
ncbi:MAG: FAD/NAD(P)-binding oxidoreductase [Thermoplasmata archaeon HGW-Thermoplasmata-1]|nr:MAG: FAD/NAD(P)-binding oxidoreductase [Thermoplasmata archaeon HGW-Thermoplasmata-1]